ncbi:hypothetical protein Bca52824_069158 [Brassica carinata]|uniref:MATH domain-containing protein n=1 Tax=Brassica carinata TaxID=52824 RepID=A0A8X7U1W6_BRACI|nr:hypothetical protein Bca52824_069158 [Brassica carinata]
MSESSNNEDNGSGQSLVEDNSDGRRSHSDALVEWRSSDQVENGFPSTSPPYWDIDENGSKHAELYGKHTWKIENYSENYKRELRSDVFDAGGYKWYISIYPTRWDDCNHLAVYLCLTNHEELRPGWSHFAQYTLALMNKDPQKSRYLDSVNQFQKKERDWGWSKFIELHKLHEGYIHDLDSLIIKAKVQVIRERVDRPLRCLSSQYRRELVRVYLPYVENICWQFMEAERIRFNKLIQNKEKFQRKMDVVLNLAARIFFVMRQGTSTLMMDSLYSGWKAIEGQTKKKISRQRQMDNVELPAAPAPIVSVDQDMFVLVDDLLPLMQRTVFAPSRIKEVNGSQNPSKVGDVGGEYSKEAIVRDESRLTEVGRRTMEILVLAHIYSNKVKVAYKEDIALIMQEKLINEEEEEKAKRGTIEKERKSKKKQAKQKKNKKEKRKEERLRSQAEQRDTEKEESVRKKTESSTEKPDTLGESSPVHRELDASEIHHPSSEDTSRGRSSSISIPSGGGSSISSPNEVANGSYKGDVSNWQTKSRRKKGKTPPRKKSGANSLATETENQPSRHASNPKIQSHSSETRRVGVAEAVISRIQEAHNPNPVSKDRGSVQTQQKSPAVFSPPKTSPWNLPSVAQAKPEERGVFNVDTIPNRKAISSRSSLSDQASPSRDIQFQTVGSRAAVQNTTSPIPSLSRPLRAPTVSAARTSTTSFARSVSSTGRVSAPTHSQNYIPPSYKHAVVGSLSSDHSSSHSTGTSALLSVSNQSGFPIDVGSADVWSGGLLWTGGSSSNRDTTQSLMTDEFPHHGIINDLLEEEHGLMNTSRYLRFPQWLNDVYSFLADMEISGKSRSYSNDGFKQSYMSGSSSSSSSLYGNGQMDGLTRQTRANMDLSLLAMRSQNNASESTYRNVGSSNPNLSARINSYRAFRSSNGN